MLLQLLHRSRENRQSVAVRSHRHRWKHKGVVGGPCGIGDSVVGMHNQRLGEYRIISGRVWGRLGRKNSALGDHGSGMEGHCCTATAAIA